MKTKVQKVKNKNVINKKDFLFITLNPDISFNPKDIYPLFDYAINSFKFVKIAKKQLNWRGSWGRARSKEQRENLLGEKGKGKGHRSLSAPDLTRHTNRAHARTHDTKRFPGWCHSPNLRFITSGKTETKND